jgi:hypothetical protein
VTAATPLDWHHGLLRARYQRPRSRAAKERDERASVQLVELHSLP